MSCQNPQVGKIRNHADADADDMKVAETTGSCCAGLVAKLGIHACQ